MGEPAKKWKIVSDGTSLGTKVFSPDGAAVGRVQSLTLFFDCEDALVKGTMTVLMPEVEVEILEGCMAVGKGRIFHVEGTNVEELVHGENR